MVVNFIIVAMICVSSITILALVGAILYICYAENHIYYKWLSELFKINMRRLVGRKFRVLNYTSTIEEETVLWAGP